MRIAICTDIYMPQLSGISDAVFLLSKELTRVGHTVRIYGPKVKTDFEDTVSVKRLPVYYISDSVEAIAIVFPIGMYTDIKDFNPDIIHTHTNSFSFIGMVCLYIKYRLKIPLVATDHTFPADHMHYFKLNYRPIIFLVRKYSSWYYNFCDYVITPSKSLVTELKMYGLRVASEIISNPIDTDLFQPATPGEISLVPRILLFGRIALEKNLGFALEVIAEVCKYKAVEVIVVGNGPYKENFNTLAKKLGLEKSIHHKGLLRGEELVRAINMADIYLITSTSDTQSMTTLQAMACGLPVVGARAGGLPEYIRDGVTGFVVNPTDKEKFVEKIVELLEDVNKRHRFGKVGREVADTFSPNQVVQRTVTIYNRVSEKLL